MSDETELAPAAEPTPALEPVPARTPRMAMSDQVRGRLGAIAETATEADRQAIAEIIAKAQTGEHLVEVCEVTPAMAAIVFLNYNKHNRDWTPSKSLEFAQQMIAGMWRWNGATWVWYEGDGGLGDAQHRASAQALAGKTMKIIMVYGLQRPDIVTVDMNRRRSAAQSATLEGIVRAAQKQQVIKACIAYENRRLNRYDEKLFDITLRDMIIQNDHSLSQALAVGDASVKDIARPVLKPIDAAKVAYLMLSAQHPWPAATVFEHLKLLQAGQAQGEKDPVFQAAEMITKAAEQRKGREKLGEVARCGLVVLAFNLIERGIHAVRPQELNTIKKRLPAPDFPDDFAAAAEE